MKVVFLDASTMGDTPLDPIAALGELVCYPTSTPEEARARVGDCDVLIINKIVVAVEYMLYENAKIAKDDPYFYTIGMIDDPMYMMEYNSSMAWSLMNYRNSLEENEEEYNDATTEKTADGETATQISVC